MVSEVLVRTAALRRALRWHEHLAWVGLFATLGLLPLVFYLSHTIGARALLGAVTALYLGRKAFQFFHTRHVRKHLRLEGHFIRHTRTSEQLSRCLKRHRHLWMHSRIVHGLKAALARPLPHLMLYTDKQRYYTRQFHLAFKGVRPHRLNTDLLLLLLVPVGWVMTSPATTVTVATLTTLPLLFLLGLELAQTVLQWRLYRRYLDFEQLLAQWALAQQFENALRPPRPYHHTLLYQAHPWFTHAA